MNLVPSMLRMATTLPPRRARMVVAAILAREDGGDPLHAWKARAAAAWEHDLQAVRTAIASALHAGTADALRGLRHLLPGLLREVNRAPSLALVLAQTMAVSLTDEPPLHAAEGDTEIGSVLFSEDPVVTEGLRHWRSREVFETDLSSAELRGFSQQLRNRSIFSARTTSAEYLKEVATVVDDILAGKIGMTEGRVRLMRKLKQLGYDPAVGFPDDMAAIPPAERGSLQDLSSERRIDLVLETNVRLAQGYAQQLAGNSEQMRYSHPAWELTRLYHRDVPRGSAQSKSIGWQQRWSDAWSEVNGEGALENDFIALKDSPLWPALGDGAGGYTDTLLNPFPPFAFRSGYAWKPVPRERAVALGLIRDREIPGASAATLTPGQKEVLRIVEDMPADLRAELERELGL